MVMKTDLIPKKILLFIPVMALIAFTASAVAQEEENVSIKVNAPEFVSGTFDVTIDIDGVTDMTSGQLDISFDPDVVNVNDVCDGEIDGTTVPIEDWLLMDGADRVRVLVKLPDADLVSGSGYLTTINFEVVGDDGDTSTLEVSDGELFSCITYYFQTYSSSELVEINADWYGDVVTVGDTGTVETGKTASTPVRTATPRLAPSSLDSGAEPATTSTIATEHVSDASVPVGASEKGGPDWWDVFVEHNFIGTYLFIGLLAFTYTLILLR